MIFGEESSYASSSACDGRTGRLCLFMFSLALGFAAAFVCTAIVDADDAYGDCKFCDFNGKTWLDCCDLPGYTFVGDSPSKLVRHVVNGTPDVNCGFDGCEFYDFEGKSKTGDYEKSPGYVYVSVPSSKLVMQEFPNTAFEEGGGSVKVEKTCVRGEDKFKLPEYKPELPEYKPELPEHKFDPEYDWRAPEHFVEG